MCQSQILSSAQLAIGHIQFRVDRCQLFGRCTRLVAMSIVQTCAKNTVLLVNLPRKIMRIKDGVFCSNNDGCRGTPCNLTFLAARRAVHEYKQLLRRHFNHPTIRHQILSSLAALRLIQCFLASSNIPSIWPACHYHGRWSCNSVATGGRPADWQSYRTHHYYHPYLASLLNYHYQN